MVSFLDIFQNSRLILKPLIIKTACHWRRSGSFIVYFEQVSVCLVNITEFERIN